MKKIIIISFLIMNITNVSAKEKCKDLPGFKTVGPESTTYIKCLAKKLKSGTKSSDSKLKNWLTGKEKLKIPNPIEGLKKVGKALEPSALKKK
jgi:hypothetical protein